MKVMNKVKALLSPNIEVIDSIFPEIILRNKSVFKLTKNKIIITRNIIVAFFPLFNKLTLPRKQCFNFIFILVLIYRLE